MLRSSIKAFFVSLILTLLGLASSSGWRKVESAANFTSGYGNIYVSDTDK